MVERPITDQVCHAHTSRDRIKRNNGRLIHNLLAERSFFGYIADVVTFGTPHF